MTRRRRTPRRVPFGVWALVAAIAVGSIAHGWAGVAAVLILAAVIAGGWAYLRRGGPVTLRRPPRPRTVPRAPSTSARAPRPSTARDDARARRNGWAPPARPRMVTLSVSEECAADMCAICPGGSCECRCEHDPAVIVAMNTARNVTMKDPGPARPDDTEPPF